MSKRRTPPLFEVLSGPDHRPGFPRSSSVLGGRGPVRVEAPQPAQPVQGGADQQAVVPPARAVRISLATACIGAGILVALFFGGWALVYQLGAKQKESDLAPYLESKATPPSQAAAPIPAPAIYQGDATPAASAPANVPPEVSDPTLIDPRKPGVNYLHIATLAWKDAHRAVVYLNEHGVAAAAAPAKPVDPLEARAKNLPHVVFAIDGVPSDQYRASAAKRQALEERVRSIGKRWQREEHGPSDFGQPGWSKFK
jgi:hypothetical protein